jgi:FixJ family two-component response regulator
VFVRGAIQFLYKPFEPNDIDVVERAYAKLGKTRQSIQQNEVALEILEALIIKR